MLVFVTVPASVKADLKVARHDVTLVKQDVGRLPLAVGFVRPITEE